MDCFHGNGNENGNMPCIFFAFERRQIQNLQLKCASYNKLLTSLACSSCTWEYWPSTVFYGPCCKVCI